MEPQGSYVIRRPSKSVRVQLVDLSETAVGTVASPSNGNLEWVRQIAMLADEAVKGGLPRTIAFALE